VLSSMQSITSLFVRPDAVALLARLHTFLIAQKIETYLVGGYIRDGFLGRSNHDIDLAVNADAIQVARQVADAFDARFVLLDEVHQIARVVLVHDEDRWYIDFATIRGSIEDDLRKRDFTVDAIAMKLEHLAAGWNRVDLIDPLDGVGDLERKLIRVASDSAFLDDPARLMRAFRLATELDFSIDSRTEGLIQRDNGAIISVSGERIREELGRILETKNATNSIRHLDQLGLLTLLIPELSVSKGVEQPKEHYWNVFEHSIETVAAVERLLMALNSKEEGLLDSLSYREVLVEHFDEVIGGGLTRRSLVKLAALIHDVAKPQTKAIHENGKMRFLGHAQQGAKIAEGILERLRFSTREKRIVTGMIDQHLRPGHLSNAPELPTRRAIYRYFRDTGDIGIDTLFLSLADHLATRGPTFEMAGWLEHVEVTEYMLNKRIEDADTVLPPKLVSGHTLIERFGLEPGPEIGRLLEAVREAQASGEIMSEQDALDFVGKELSTNNANQR